MLNSAIAQSIVDITMSVLHVNVNIMDVNGTVIAAGDKSRIGTFHCAAAEVIATGQKKAVSAQEAATMDNVEPGATYPIVYKGEVIGALGMTGAPEYVDKFVELGALYALLFIEQEDMKQRVFQEQRVRESILLDLFTGRCLKDADFFLQRLAGLNYRLDKAHRVIAVRLEALEHQTDMILCQQIKDRLTDLLANKRICGAPPIGCFVQSHLALLAPVQNKPCAPERFAAEVKDLYDCLRQATGNQVLIAIDGICESWMDIPAAFAQAKGTLEIACRYNQKDGVIRSDDYLTEYTLLHIPAQERQRFTSTVLGKLCTGKPRQRELLLQTLRTYFQNDMNAQKTAEELFIHRNTLNMRLNKIREWSGLSPQRFQDAFNLRMAIILMDLEEKADQAKEENTEK
ncbi:MAG: CdaR family transcriptional regulator [Oscillospiraceae bacterium]